jgi:hypothetical protein
LTKEKKKSDCLLPVALVLGTIVLINVVLPISQWKKNYFIRLFHLVLLLISSSWSIEKVIFILKLFKVLNYTKKLILSYFLLWIKTKRNNHFF